MLEIESEKVREREIHQMMDLSSCVSASPSVPCVSAAIPVGQGQVDETASGVFEIIIVDAPGAGRRE